MFEEARARVKVLIDEQLGIARATASGEFAAVELRSIAGARQSGFPAAQSTISRAAPRELRSIEATHASPISEAPITPRSPPFHGKLREAPYDARAALILGASAIVVALALAITTFVIVRPRAAKNGTLPSDASPATPAPSPPASLDGGGGAAPSERIRIDIAALPQNALIFIDDAPAAPNPLSADAPKDGTVHRLRVEAPGFKSHIEAIPYNANIGLTVRLEPLATSWRSAAFARPITMHPPVPPASIAPAPSAAASRGGERPKREIDQTNPYGDP